MKADHSGMQQQNNNRSAPAPTSGYAAGSEGWDGSEDATQPALSSSRNAASQDDEKILQQSQASSFGLQADETVQSANSLSQSSDDQAEDGRFSVAEEQNFDQQSDQARRVGQMPQGLAGAGVTDENPSEAMAKSMTSDKAEMSKSKRDKSLAQSVERAVPPSDDGSVSTPTERQQSSNNDK